MNPISLAVKEIRYRAKSSVCTVLIVALLISALVWLSVNNSGFQREVSRGARDIGSNVVILPGPTDQFEYFNNGGFTDETMPESTVEQLLEFRASLNHLIPMLERKAMVRSNGISQTARVVGISASIPVPGRPKAPMRKSVAKGCVQIGEQLAEKLKIERDQGGEITIEGSSYIVDRVNRSNGTWQDSAVFLDLEDAQSLFNLSNRISRIEAIECTSEQCAATGLSSDVVLINELARITAGAQLLRREKMADARSMIRSVAGNNQELLQSVFWVLLVLVVMLQAALNSYQRQSEIGVYQAMGVGGIRVISLIVMRSLFLTTIGAAIGMVIGAWVSLAQSSALFEVTGKKMVIDWAVAGVIVVVAILLSLIASAFPAILAAVRNPAELIGKEG